MSVTTDAAHQGSGEALDYRALFESGPGLFLVLNPDFVIVAASDAYLAATMTRRDQIVGRGIFDAFPDNPDDADATGVRNLRASLMRVREGGVADVMALQKYDIRRPDCEGGEFEVCYWSPVNSPVFRRGTSQLLYIIHRVDEVKARDAEDRARALMNSAPDAIVVTARDGRIVLVNNRTEALLGYSREELLGQPVEILLPE